MKTVRILPAATAVVLTLGAWSSGLTAQAVPTDIVVRAIANDAKLIGSGVGGARIVIRDTRTGAVLAEGLHEGSTGDTRAIVVSPRERGARVFDTEGAVAFRATLQLEGPTLVEITAEGPLGNPHAMQRASKTLLMLPGEHVTGEGVALVLNGFTVDIEGPNGGWFAAGDPFDVTAKVTMLCGCPTEPGGLWDADDFTITARLMDGSRVAAETTLRYAGETSTYSGRMTTPAAGNYELWVSAVDAGKANTGFARRPITVR